MKVTFDVECTPEEARKFLGLPDVAPMQEALMKELEEQMRENMRSLDPETMLKTWLPATIEGWGQVQKMFWDHMGSANKAGVPSATQAKSK
jgi:tetrahydromethanopterin S-methyltransferase subunit B